MIFHRRRYLLLVLSYIVNENDINRVEDCRFLGIVVDDHLNFKKHVEFTLGKLAKYLYNLCKVRSFVPTKELVQIYYLLFYPHFN